jgi:hypothetical protein
MVCTEKRRDYSEGARVWEEQFAGPVSSPPPRGEGSIKLHRKRRGDRFPLGQRPDRNSPGENAPIVPLHKEHS